MAKLNLEKFKANADKIIQEKSSQGLFTDSQKKLVTLEIDQLTENPYKIRLDNSHLENLSDSIEYFGQLEPITVMPYEDSFMILNGHSRVDAIRALGGESVFCLVSNIIDDDAIYYPYLLNKYSLDEFEVAYYIDRLLSSGISAKSIRKKLGINVEEYPKFTFEYNLFDVLKKDENITYNHLKDISKVKDEALRDEALDHIVQKLISTEEIENFLAKVNEENVGKRFVGKADGLRVKKNSYKINIDIDERYLQYGDIRTIYDFIDSLHIDIQ